MIACFGDSFTYGEELSDVNCAWPYILGKKLNQPVINKGIMGANNELIARTVIELVETTNIDIVVIGWSDCNRVEFYSQQPLLTRRYKNYTGPVCINPGWVDGTIDFIKEYYVNWHSDNFSLKKWLSTVVMLQGYLEHKNIDYYFANAFGNQQLLTQNRSDLELQFWIDKINTSRFIGWPTQGFVEWAYGKPIGPGGHPLEEGHTLIAETIYEHIRNQ